MALFWTDSVILVCSDVAATADWWIRYFQCKRVALPRDWDDPLPSDVALQLPGADRPTILLSAHAEVPTDRSHIPSNPILFTSKATRAREHLCAKGLAPGPIAQSGDVSYFDLADGLGNTIEICEEV